MSGTELIVSEAVLKKKEPFLDLTKLIFQGKE
jgi:hypothetical protein